MPKVSIILTSYNHDKYLREAIESILNQTFQDFELIIWDDASVDNSWEIIQSYRDNDPRIQAFQNPQNRGPVFGINKAIFEITRGEYIAIHHSDDIWELNKLAKQVNFLDANQDIGAVFSNAQVIDQRGMPLTDQLHFYYNVFSQANRSRHDWLRHFFLKGNVLCHPSLLIRKQCYLDCGAYRDMLAQMPDFDMWIRLCAQYEIHVMAEHLIKFRILDGEMNTSGNRPENHIRSAIEYYKLLQQYRKLLTSDNIFKVFPDFKSYSRGEDTDIEYVLSRVCLETGDFFLRQLLAIEILFDILNDPARRQAIEQAYGFSSKDFIAFTGQCDCFLRHELIKLQGIIVERYTQTNNLTQLVAEHEGHVTYLKQVIVERDEQINNRDQTIAEHEGHERHVTYLKQVIIERDEQINKLNQTIVEHEGYITCLKQVIVERDEQINKLNQTIAEHEGHVTYLKQVIVDRDDQINKLNQTIAEHEGHITYLKQVIVDRDNQINNLNQTMSEYDKFLQIIENSLSWKITSPLRKSFGSASPLRTITRRAVKLIWWTMTFQLPKKLRERQSLMIVQKENIAEDIEKTHILLPYKEAIDNPDFPLLSDDYCFAVPFDYSIEKPAIAPSIAVICHLYYPEMLEEFKGYFLNIPFAFDLFITTDTEQKKNDIAKGLLDWDKGAVDIRIVPNRGRDIAPKLISCHDVYEHYEFFLHIHSKKSPHGGEALAAWRHYLLDVLLGSEKIVTSIFEAFASDPSLGMIAPEHFESIRNYVNWGANFEIAQQFSSRFDVKLSVNSKMDFPSGSMFWGRSSAIQPLLDMGLSVKEFPVEDNQTDVTLAHVIERFYFFICELAGYRWIKIASPTLLKNVERMIWVESKDSLIKAIECTQYGLLTTSKEKSSKLSTLKIGSRHAGRQLQDWRMIHIKSDLRELDFSQFCQALEQHIAKRKSLIAFDENFYLTLNPDIAEAVAKGDVLCGYIHYCLTGQYEGRTHNAPHFKNKGFWNNPPLHLLRTRIEQGEILNPTLLFDHNSGGGANAYSHELIKSIHVNGGVVLRVYCFDGIWFVQWSDEIPFFTFSIEELFEVLSMSHSTTIICNSLYGYPDIKVAIANIVNVTKTLNASLDFKVHDFYALCPSPHLSNADGNYCGVPKDKGICKDCLKKNLSWYYSWYPNENIPTDIAEWRKPFADFFAAATTITFFDPSSVEIVRKDFYLDDSKIKVVPHVIHYFKCDEPIDITGTLHIGILGTLSQIKGGNVVNVLCQYINEQNLDIPITVVGSSVIETQPKINVYGKYTPNELPTIISERGINVILMPSIVPETFSYTISEAMEMGLPIVAFDIGAQGRRVQQYALGKVIPIDSSSAVILAAIQSVLKMAQE